MRRNFDTQQLKKVLLLAVGIPALLYILWTTSHFVIAYQEIKHAHILPQTVEGDGWNEPENSLSQDLSAQAPLGSFSKNNSAFIELAASTSTNNDEEIHVPVPQQPIQLPTPVATSTATSTSTPETGSASSTIALPLPVIVPSTTPLITLEPTTTPTSTPQVSTTTEIVPPPQPEHTPSSTVASSSQESIATSTIELPPPNIVEILEANMPLTAPTSSATSTVSTSTSSFIQKFMPIASRSLQSAGEFILTHLAETAFATTTGVSTPATSSATTTGSVVPNSDDEEVESTSTPMMVHGMASSTPPAIPDVSSCSTLGTSCHTMEFGGFGVSGSMTEKDFHGAVLKFSFASVSAESPREDSKFEVRYYHAGKWQTAGEIYLNKEISNFTNGGYFSTKLNDIDSWDDLSDLHVVVEFVRGDNHIENKVYLDSLWVDTSFKDRVQDVITGNTEEIEDAPENVTFDLPQGQASYNSLITEDGKHIDFPYVDTLSDDSLVVRMDRQQYKVPKDKSANSVFASVTNTTQTPTKFRVYASFPGGKGEVLKLARYLRDVPVSTSTPIYHDVTYFCNDGWRNVASSTNGYQCAPLPDSYQCDAITDSGVNCLVKNVHVSDATTTSYASAWVDAEESHIVDQDKDVMAVLPPGYIVSASSDQEFDILPGQTIYLQLQIQTPDSTTRKFVLSVKGSGVFGDADSLRLKDEEAWRAQLKFAEARHAPEHVNDQVTGKNDFAVDEVPSFRFKFKTQRSFFQRVLDFVTRNNTSYRVDRAILIRQVDGEEEHVPVQIGYDINGEWELQLGKPPRSFRPGKYTVELTMNEAGQTYTDSIEFYWGVLAVNTSKTVYNLGEKAHMMMAVLDDNGDTLCDAQLELNITDPTGATEGVPVVSGGGCGFNNVTDLPDYVADFDPTIVGEYTITLSRLDIHGAVINSTSDSFEVEADPAISIERVGPTRIYPISTYQMHFNITARDAFIGTVTEILPEGFTVPGLGGGKLVRKNGALYLSWDLDLAAGASTTLSYTFKAPDASPYLYVLGPAVFTEIPSGNKVFEEGRTWKIASDALSIATGVAWLSGTTTTNGVELNNSTAAALAWTTDDYDTTYFSHSTTTNNTKLTVTTAGDYLVSVTLPIERTDTRNAVSALETDIRVNGVKVNQGVTRSAYNERSTQTESSEHITMILHNLNANDYIEAYVHTISTYNVLNTIRIGSQASLYAEYIPTSETIFSATATTTTTGTNLNPTATSSMVWYDVGSRVDSGYTHLNGPSTTASVIILPSAGDYLVSVNIPVEGATADARARGRVMIDGVIATSSDMKQDYIANATGHTQNSMQWNGVVHATSSSNLSIAMQTANTAGGTLTVNAETASIYIQKLPTSDVYLGVATTTSSGTSFNPSPTAANILWQWDDIKDTSTYTHSTSTNPHQITVNRAGDYLLAFNEDLTGSINRGNPEMQVLINGAVGTAVTGAQAKGTFVTNTSGDGMTSGTLLYFLRNLNANDVVSLQTVAAGATGAMVADKRALVMLWRKAAQSNWIQHTEAWYQNIDAQTPTTAWSGTSEGDAITSGNAVLSGNAIRLRMALQAQTNTAAGDDTFKLQYAAGTTCSPALTWSDVGATGSGSIWRAKDNASVTAGSTLSTRLLSVSTVSETYEESNPSASTPNSVTSGTDAEWDWSLEDNGAAVGTSYCFRMVHSSGQLLKNYSDYPQLVTNNSPGTPTLSTPFDNEKLASTSPWFTFAASDDNGDDENYQVQIASTTAFAAGDIIVDTDSNTNTNDFDNVQTPSNRQPFNSGETIRYKTASTLVNGRTYYWRVRAIDPYPGASTAGGTNAYGSWSSTQSFTVDTAVTVSTWFQTQASQFNQGTLYNVESTSTQDVGMASGAASGTIASPAILYSSHVTGNSWGTLSKSDSVALPNTLKYQIEYLDSTSTWTLVPDTDLSGNSSGTTTNSLTISGLDPTTYSSLRVRANFSRNTNTPRLNDWTVSWANSVARPTVYALFDNEKTPTTTPSFSFLTTDPNSKDLVYQVQWASDSAFTTIVGSSTSDRQTYGNVGGVFNSATTTSDVTPFYSGTKVTMQIATGSALTNGSTYWWRVRARPFDSTGYSLWSLVRSFTIDTTVSSSTWYQTTTDQFNTDTLSRVTALNNTASGVTDVGKIAIYRAATAGDIINAASTTNHTFDTTVRQDDIYSMQYASSSIKLKAGYYAVMYGFRSDSTGGTSQSTMHSNFSLSSTSLPIGWSSGLNRRTTGALEAFNSGGGIVKATTDNTPLVLQTFRTDTLTTNTQTRTANTPGIELVRLDSSWPYLRLSKTGTQVGPTNSNWVSVRYDREDEVNTDYYSHTQGNASITIYKTGHYLVFANTYGAVTAGTNNVINQKLVLNGSDVRGSYGSLYMTSTNSNFEGAPSIGMILNVTSPTSTLSVQVNHSIGTNPWTINAKTSGTYVDRTGITIVKVPEGDFIRLATSTAPAMNNTAITPVYWGLEDEYDTGSFTHSTVTNPNRVQVSVAGDYLAFSTLYATTTIQATTNYQQGWQKNGGGLIQYGQTGGFNNSATAGNSAGNWTGTIFPSLINGDYFEAITQGLGTNVSGLRASDRELEAVRIASLTENDTTAQTIQSTDINFSDGNGPRWDAFSWNHTTPGSTAIKYSVYYYSTASSTYVLVPDSALTGKNPNLTNSVGTSTGPIDISGLDRTTYAILRVQATLTCAAGSCPTLNDWTVTWNPGITVSGIAKQFNESTNVTSGTVAVAVNGTIQTGKTANISSGTWTLNGINAGIGDVITVWIAGTAETSEAVAITKPTQTGNVTNMALYEGHVTLGSDDNPTISNTDIGQYDNSVSGNEDIFDDVDASGNLTVCSISGCFLNKLLVKSGTIYRPSSAGAVNITTRHFQNDGTTIADGNTFNISGSYLNTYVFTKGTSQVNFTATSTTERINSTGATSSAAFYSVAFSTTTTATSIWQLITPLSASSTLSITSGTLVQGATSTIFLSGDFTIGTNGIFAKNASTTFMGTVTETWTDNSSGQDIGVVIIGGASTTVQLGSAVKATDITIKAGNMLDASSGNYNLNVIGNWVNSNLFNARSGTVTFLATSTGKTITPGISSFYNMTFNGANGNWSFTTPTTTALNNFTIATGTVTLPTGTTTVGGNWDTWVATGTPFQHNNGTVLFNSIASGKTIHIATTTSFYDLTFNGSGGSWSFIDQNATSSRTVLIQAGTVTMPTGTFAVGGTLTNSGTITANNGTLKFTAASANSVTLGGSSAYNMTFNGTGPFTIADSNATSSNTVRFEAGTTTLPSGTFAIGASLLTPASPSGGFSSNNGTVKFYATATGNSVTPGISKFYNLLFNGVGGGWTITGNATSTNNTSFTQANTITQTSGTTLEVDGIFTNALANASTTWTGAALYLNSGTEYPINSKSNGGDTYGQLTLGANTQVEVWNSSAATVTTASTGGVYSQNHAGVSGALNIYGRFATSSPISWAYQMDFDNTTLGLGRQVQVRVASSSIVSLSGSTTIQGIPTASTTVASQGTGFYTFNILGGTTTAKYYSIGSTTPNGLSLFGTTTAIATLDNGAFEVNASGGSAISIGSEVIDKNPQIQILYTKFSTSTGVVTATNVTATTTPTNTLNYWWFKNGYGGLYGEAYDNDIGGSPGYIQFDDSGITAVISGHVYSDHGTTAMGNSVCQTGTTSQKVVIHTSSNLTYSGICDNSGAYSITATFVPTAVLTVYLNTNGGPRAVAVTKNVTGAVSNLDLYQNAVIVRQFDTSPTTIADLSFVDSSYDSDIAFAATSSLMVQPDNELYVWTGKLFAPGGDVILQSGGSGDARDGRLYIATSSTFTEVGTQKLSIGGGMSLDSGAIFTAANSVVSFTATTTGKSIYSSAPLTLYDVVLSGTGGGWNFLGTSTATTTMHTLTPTLGTMSGGGDIDVQSGNITGGGIISMTGGTFLYEPTGNFGNSNAWTFSSLTFGTSTANTVTKYGTATTTVTSVLKIATNQTLLAGTSTTGAWVLSGGGTPFVINGTFNPQLAPFWYTSNSATNIAGTSYGPLVLAPSAAGSPTYTLTTTPTGTYTLGTTTIGNGTNPVTVTADTNDPTVNFTRDFTINSNATFVASNLIDINSEGSWANSGTFTPSGRTVIFDATSTGRTINPGSSSFANIRFNSSSGGWTISTNATTTANTTLSAAQSFTLSNGKSLEVDGTFSNSVASSSQTWTGSLLFLNSGTTYTINSKSSGNATYGTLTLGANTNVSNWNSAQASTVLVASSSLYAMNYASSSGALNIYGKYYKSSGTDYWDYAADFDGISLGGTSRKVNVNVASGASVIYTGTSQLEMIGSASASTTIQNQGSGTYLWAISGASTTMQYYEVRNTDANGLNFSGYPVITSMNNGDFLLGTDGGSSITVNGTAISSNPLKVFRYNKFATSTGVNTGFNVTPVSATSSFWKFTGHYGAFAGESYDNDTDPGFIRWDDSNDKITISGVVYTDDGVTREGSRLCDGSTQVLRLKVAGTGSATAACAAANAAFTFTNIAYNPGDVLTLYIASSSLRSATVTRGETTNVVNMDIYEHRVIVRHEDLTPITISDLDQYDSGQDSLVPFLATVGGTNTLVVEPNTKLVVWSGKTFAPAGNVTVSSGGVNSWDGSLELQSNATWTSAGTQSHSFGGSYIIGTGATYSAANSTVTFTATTTGKTITPNTSAFYNVTFNGSGGNWAFSGAATSTNDFAISAGTVTLPTSVLEVGGSFNNSGGTFQHNNGTVKLTATASGKFIQVNNSPFYNLTANGSGGSWNFYDGFATTSNNLIITAGTFKAPSTTLTVGGSFLNSGTFNANNGTVKLISTVGGKSVLAGGSDFYNLLFNGVGGGWSFSDLNATSSRDFIISTGTVTMASGTLAVGGNFNTASSTFIHNSGVVKLTATTTGFNLNVGTSTFYQLLFDSSAGGWVIGSNATSTATTSITNAASFTLTSGKSLEVDGTFNNLVGGAPTTWTGSTLYLNSGTTYSLNQRTSTQDTYGQLTLGSNTQVRSWNSTAATTTFASSAYLYSQNDANTSGRLVVYGAYSRSSGTDHWSAATDFDGTDLSASPRAVQVRVATSSSVAYTGGSLSILGTSTATTTIYASGTTGYAFSLAGGSTTMQYYQFKNIDSSGLTLSGSPVVNTLSNGDFELSAASGTAMTIAGTVIDANANVTFSNVRFASTTANTKGFNIMLSGSVPINFWTFTLAYGNISGESYDADGSNACGHIRWDDSICLQISESHYRFRNDDGGEGSATSTWFYDTSFTRRQRIAITNPNATAYTNLPVKLQIPYDSDMQSDTDDLRFTDSSGTTSIPYWRESTIVSGTTTVWVKVSSLSSLGSAIIYMYYGDAATSSADNSANTFPFIETFDDGDISDFSGSDLSLFQANASFKYGNGSYGLSASAGNTTAKTTNGGIYKTTSSISGQGKTIRYFQYVASGGQDEPCTLFGVQAAKQNYGVCLEQFPTTNRRVSLARNIAFNDNGDTASVMASTSVTYSTTGWYQVIIDWLTGGTINVNVYDPNNSLFASLSTTSSTYTTGGMGFAFFFQSQGWDSYMVKPYTASAPTYLFGAEQQNNGGSWLAAEDTRATITANRNTRLRFNVQNTGSSFNYTFRLQFAPKGASASCEAVPAVNFNDVPIYSSCGSSDVCMASSTQITTLASTSPSLTYPASYGYVQGNTVQDPYNQSYSYLVPKNYATEVEYTFKVTTHAQLPAYCFRLWNAQGSGADLDSYDHVAEGTVAYPPYISNFQLNNSQDIALTEGTSTTVYASSTVTDYNGYADIVSATSSIYLSTLNALCTSNPVNCYQISTSSCSLSNCSGNSCSMMCRADISYIAEATDASSTNYATTSTNWLATMAVTDLTGLKDTQTSIGQDILTLYGLQVDVANIAFATTTANSDTGRTVSTTTVRNTGNSAISVNVLGTDLTDGVGTIAVNNQKVASSTFQYGTCSICLVLQGASAQNVNVNIPRPSSTSTAQSTDLYWGIAIPNGTSAGTYSGTNTFIAVGAGP